MTKTVTLYSRHGCHFCNEMEALLEEYASELAFQLDIQDIDEDPQLQEKYNADVPVVMYKNALLFRHFFDKEILFQALTQECQ